jgi:hypothetical protein
VTKEIKSDPAPDLLTALCKSCGLPEPVREYRFHPVRKWRFDHAWPAPDHKIALEIEGGVWTRGRHTRGAGYLGDMAKYREAAIAGWCVLRVTPAEVRTVAVDLIRRAMEERRESPFPEALKGWRDVR